ncbi:MAG: hypothetical protein ACI857_001952 [Arenicella sp.]|jgi:hypothetical protein
MLRLSFFILLFSPFTSSAQTDSTKTDSLSSNLSSLDSTINIDINAWPFALDTTINLFELMPMHGGYRDMTPGRVIDSFPFKKEHIMGGWIRAVSSGYYTPNGDAMYEANKVHGSIYISNSKIYYLTYPHRMHSYADYEIEGSEMKMSNEVVLPDALDGFGEESRVFTKDSLSYLYFDGEYYYKQKMDSNIVFNLEKITLSPDFLVGKWERMDTLWCCYGEMWVQEYPWVMPKFLNISRDWAKKIRKRQKMYFTIDGEYRSFFIAWIGDGDELELEAGNWFKGKADRVVYHARRY